MNTDFKQCTTSTLTSLKTIYFFIYLALRHADYESQDIVLQNENESPKQPKVPTIDTAGKYTQEVRAVHTGECGVQATRPPFEPQCLGTNVGRGVRPTPAIGEAQAWRVFTALPAHCPGPHCFVKADCVSNLNLSKILSRFAAII